MHEESTRYHQLPPYPSKSPTHLYAKQQRTQHFEGANCPAAPISGAEQHGAKFSATLQELINSRNEYQARRKRQARTPLPRRRKNTANYSQL
ncbi:unnamed protein product [Gongylonema pulchrum]|uniref:Uncharacterized protein n=1 Tax=Gongylonema pulchrum TaxID=637853 RepID=A0A183E6W7_9BILA|nr:unnamed protein product [Gongylonema pulchrum]